MARPLRLQFAGAHYLITARAQDPGHLFRENRDRSLFLDLLGASCRRYRWRCHAWCLANDYYQLVIATEIANLATGMRHLNSVYSQACHRRYRCGGNLFDGRYESVVVDPARYLDVAVVDVLRAPVTAGLAARAVDWPWSSHAATVGADDAPAWLAVDEVLARFGDEREAASRSLNAALGRLPPTVDAAPGPDEASVDARCLADATYMARVLAEIEAAAAAGLSPRELRLVRPPICELLASHPDRRDAMRAAYRSGYTQKEIARHFNVHTATVSRAVSATPVRRSRGRRQAVQVSTHHAHD